MEIGRLRPKARLDLATLELFIGTAHKYGCICSVIRLKWQSLWSRNWNPFRGSAI